MATPNLLNIIDVYLARYVNALSYLHANPHVGYQDITVGGQVTRVQRFQTSRLMRSLVILTHVGLALRNGTLVSKRGLLYYYLSHFGKNGKNHFVPELKRTLNSINAPMHAVCSTEPTAKAYGDLSIRFKKTGLVIDLRLTNLLDDSVLEGGDFEILRKGQRIDKIIVVEKATIFRQMKKLKFDETMNALLFTDGGFPTTQGKAWLVTFRVALGISEDKCYGVGDFGPYGWSLLHAFAYVKNPIKCQDVYKTCLKIVVTPALILPNFLEARQVENGELTEHDYNTFGFLLDEKNEFFKHNRGVRLDQLKKMYDGGFKCDLDVLDIKNLLRVIAHAINTNKVI